MQPQVQPQAQTVQRQAQQQSLQKGHAFALTLQPRQLALTQPSRGPDYARHVFLLAYPKSTIGDIEAGRCWSSRTLGIHFRGKRAPPRSVGLLVWGTGVLGAVGRVRRVTLN